MILSTALPSIDIKQLSVELMRLEKDKRILEDEVERLEDALRDIAAAPSLYGEKRAREALLGKPND